MSGSKYQSTPSSVSSPSKEATVDVACMLANSLVLNKTQTKLKKNRTTNVSSILKQQAASYDQLVANLATARNAEKHGEDNDYPDLSNELCGLLLDGSPDIIRPLDDRVVKLSLRATATCNHDPSTSTKSVT
ncbi:hypothetical protein QQS21_010489 [Conoideocrella luteorostrata]|uniref:Uncharacterized protein n=1 Tax=Conoideocrella luteorostrata TaxID=1105319 RepID=A0AAJ0FPB3_9HYPO|nr:hypothetical protein QQS21_010489 [Conoideocrella luteorostrata]